MAKSPLTDLVARAIRTARRSRRSGVPAPELYERTLGRRALLVGAASAAALAACRKDNPVHLEEPDGGRVPEPSTRGVVAVIGAGLAGVHCAYLLGKAGVRATLYEAQSRIGGRILTDRTTFAAPDAQHCELGGELIDTAHTTMLSLCGMLGIPLYDYTTDAPGLNHIVASIGGQTLTVNDLLRGFGPIADAVDDAVDSLADPDKAPSYKRDNRGGAIDAMSLHQWLDKVDARGPTRRLLEIAYTIEYGLDPDVQSAWNFIWQIAPPNRKKLQIYGDSDERYTTRIGNDAIPQRLAARLDPAQIQLGHELTAIATNPDGRTTLTFSSGGAVKTAVFEHVVLALPFTLLRHVDLTKVEMSPVKRRAIQTLGYGTNAKLMVGFSSRVWRDTKPLGSDGTVYADRPAFQHAWESSRLQPGASGILADCSGGTLGVSVGVGTDALQRDAFLGDLDALFPGARAASNGKVTRMHWPSHRWSQGSYACYRVGQWTGISGVEIERVGNLHFCGEHTSLAFQGFMEGAAETGAMAAAEVLSDLGIADVGDAAGVDAPRR